MTAALPVRRLALACALGAAAGCRHRAAPPPPAPNASPPVAAKPSRPADPRPGRRCRPSAAGETYAYDHGNARKMTVEAARAAGLLDVDLSDGWAPFILQDGDGDGVQAERLPRDVRGPRQRDAWTPTASP